MSTSCSYEKRYSAVEHLSTYLSKKPCCTTRLRAATERTSPPPCAVVIELSMETIAVSISSLYCVNLLKCLLIMSAKDWNILSPWSIKSILLNSDISAIVLRPLRAYKTIRSFFCSKHLHRIGAVLYLMQSSTALEVWLSDKLSSKSVVWSHSTFSVMSSISA